MNASPADLELFWEQLLEYIEEGCVVPVVGQGLLALPLAGGEVPLYRLLAERLAARLKVEVETYPPGSELDEVAYRYLARGGNVQYLYSSLKSAMPPPQELPIPRPLLQLARIEKLRLFITTTFDSLLARALDQERFAGEPRTEVFSYSPGAIDPGDIGDRGAAVLHLFGKLSALSSEYALTEEDKLEFVHSLQGEGTRPHVLDELAERPLLVLGTGFPDWLARFFLRLGAGTRLSARRGKTDVFADRAAGGQEGLALFLRTFGPGIQVFTGDATEFVDELARRWSAAHPPPPTTATAAAGANLEEDPAAGVPRPARADRQLGAIFLSYATEDLPAARALHDALAARHLEVWFDKQALEGGDDYRLKIRRAIQDSCLFVPVISRHTLTDQPRFFRREWTEAIDLAPLFPPNRPFILPVVVDDVSASDEALPELFRNLHWTRLPDGRTDEQFVERLRDLYRKYQQANQQARVSPA
jgi:TIR domain-containing protein/SIR2-like protein